MWIITDGRWNPDEYDAHVFDVSFDSRHAEFQIHAEIGDRTAARAEVDLYAPVFGQLPAALIEHLREVEVYESPAQYYMGSRRCSTSDSPCIVGIDTTISHERDMMDRGVIEEYVIHEAVHVSWDDEHLAAPGWLEAQQADPVIISPYARDHPDREDLADTAVAWFAVRYRPDRISPAQHQAIVDGIPNRLAYLDRQHFDMSPCVRAAPVSALPLAGLLLLGGLLMAFGVHWSSSRFRSARVQARP